MRLDPSMTALTAMSSFSDAHESIEVPVIAANLQYILPPCQSQIWCVLKPEFDQKRFSYTISAGFLGRICWSGDIMGLSGKQMEEIYKAEQFYDELSDIIRHGKSRIFRTERLINFRHPKGTQVVLRYADKGDKALVVYHCFENPKRLEIELDGSWKIAKTLYEADVSVPDKLVINENREIYGNVVLLERIGAGK